MTIAALTLLGLFCFIGYDIWTVKQAKSPFLSSLFWLGCLCDMLASIILLWIAFPAAERNFFGAVMFWMLAALSLGVLIYTLFFALPFDDTYLDPTKKRKVCRVGMYALCRHPGVLWFILFYLFLFLAAPCPVSFFGGFALSAANILYIIFQDVWSFPRTFSDYYSYQREVPFFIPTAKSIKTAWKTR